jgi:hypothetical protein
LKRIALLLALGCAAYANTFDHPFIYDDLVAIADNPQIRSLEPSVALAPLQESPTAGRPLLNASFALNYAVGGLRVAGYHAVNLALHLACGLLLLGIVRRTCTSKRLPDIVRRRSDEIALASALLWILHPLNTEAVDYLTQRSETLMAVCYLATIYAVARRMPVAAVVACAAGMACKESMVTAPVAALLYDRAFLSDSWGSAFRARWRTYVGLAATWIVLGTLMVQAPRPRTVGFNAGVTAWTYLLNQAEMVTRYFMLVVWPRALVLAYGPPRTLTLGDVLPQAALVLALLAGAVVLFLRRPAAGFAGVWVFLTLAPTSSIVPIVSEVGAERRMYLPLAGLIPLIVASAIVVWERLQPRQSTGLRAGALAIIAALAAFGTLVRNRDYRSPLAMAETVAARWPTAYAETMVGASLGLEGRHDEAVQRLRPAVDGYPQARYFLGVELFETGALQDAIDQLDQYIAGDPRRAEAVRASTIVEQAHARIADAAFAERRFAEAETHYLAYLRTAPNDEKAVTNLGVSLASQGRLTEAIVQFRRAVELSPGSASARQNLLRAQAMLER